MRRPRRRQSAPSQPNHERWLVSYADFITLLFAFFTTLYAISVIDSDKGSRLVRSIRESFGIRLLDIGSDNPGIFDASFDHLSRPGNDTDGIDTGNSSSAQLAMIEKSVEDLAVSKQLERGVSVRRSEEGLVISLADTQFFKGGSASLSGPALAMIRDVAGILKGLPNHVRVEGHTDDQPVSTATIPSNWHLSANRAVTVVQELEKAGIARYRLSASGFADQRPLVSNRTPEGRQMNRRVELVILRSHVSGGVP
jgi:chemotaxis protein MotB